MDTQHRILIFSTRLSECKKSEPSVSEIQNIRNVIQSTLFDFNILICVYIFITGI